MKYSSTNIGDLRYQIDILRVVKTKVGSSFNITYEPLYNGLKSSRKYINGTKLIDNEEIFNSRIMQFETYYRNGIDENCVIEFESKKYKINFIEIIGFNEGMKFSVELINN